MTTGTAKARNGRDCCKAREQVQFQLAVGNARLDVTLAHETTEQSTVKGSKTATGMEAWAAIDLQGRARLGSALLCVQWVRCMGNRAYCGGCREDGDHPSKARAMALGARGETASPHW